MLTLKLATSLDGRIASESGESQWITSPAARARGHALRHQLDAIAAQIILQTWLNTRRSQEN